MKKVFAYLLGVIGLGMLLVALPLRLYQGDFKPAYVIGVFFWIGVVYWSWTVIRPRAELPPQVP